MIQTLRISNSEKGELNRFFNSQILNDGILTLCVIEKEDYLNVLYTDNPSKDLPKSLEHVKGFIKELEED
jgi:hypothetical protein